MSWGALLLRPNDAARSERIDDYSRYLAVAVVEPLSGKPSVGPNAVQLLLGFTTARKHCHQSQRHAAARLQNPESLQRIERSPDLHPAINIVSDDIDHSDPVSRLAKLGLELIVGRSARAVTVDARLFDLVALELHAKRFTGAVAVCAAHVQKSQEWQGRESIMGARQ